MEKLLSRFRSAHTQVLGVSIDSTFCHTNWGLSLGGISFPLLADWHPKGSMADSFGLYLGDKGITDRATVVIDASGVVRHALSVTPAGQRDIAELAQLCASIDKEHGGGLADFPKPSGIDSGATLYVKSACGASRAVKLAMTNLHLAGSISTKNVTKDSAAMEDLKKIAGKDQAPCLVSGGKPIHESAAIIQHLVTAATDLPG